MALFGGTVGVGAGVAPGRGVAMFLPWHAGGTYVSGRGVGVDGGAVRTGSELVAAGDGVESSGDAAEPDGGAPHAAAATSAMISGRTRALTARAAGAP